MHEDVVLAVAGVLVGGVVAQWLGWRLRVPAIVFLLAGGLVVGPITGALDPQETFGDLLFPGVSIAVAVILFEGALGLGWRGVREAGRTVWLLLTVGALVTLVSTAVLARFVLDIGWDIAALLAAVLVVTGPTVIGPIVRSVGLRGRVGAILEAEGTLIDPIGAILAVLVFQAGFESLDGTGEIAEALVTTLLVGSAVGLGGAVLLVIAFSRYLVPDQLHNASTLAVVVGLFGVANLLHEEAGLVAVTVMGIALASQSRVPVQHILDFNETLRILFISSLFVLLGASIESETLRTLEWRNVVFLVALVVLVRPVAVLCSTLRSPLSRAERLFIGSTAPRGIVAAAVASIFALRLDELGVDDSQVLVSAAFTVIAGTVLLSGLVSRPLAVRLGLTEAKRGTIVVLGANPLARALAAALEQQGASARLVDLNRRELAAARMTGLFAHRGSVFADDTWEEVGLASAGAFVAVTGKDELNTLASRHAAAVLGRQHVFQLAPGRPEHRAWWEFGPGIFARPVFSPALSYEALTARLDDGWKVASTRLTEQFGPDDHARVHPDAVVLFTVDAKDNVVMASPGGRKPKVGDTVVTLTPGARTG